MFLLGNVCPTKSTRIVAYVAVVIINTFSFVIVPSDSKKIIIKKKTKKRATSG